jgi:asparagine synthase (glutamine-hydrolysing)
MCSITAALNLSNSDETQRAMALHVSKLQRHRGPDWSGVYQHANAILSHERLAIVDVSSGAQPLIDPDNGTALAVNGEIYNHASIREKTASYPYQTGSDCEVILALYRDFGAGLVDHLEGMFSFVLFDPKKNTWIIGRDPIGIIPLYFGHDENGTLLVASEMKAIASLCDDVSEFPPGHTWSSVQASPQKYFKTDWMEWDSAPKKQARLERAKSSAYRICSLTLNGRCAVWSSHQRWTRLKRYCSDRSIVFEKKGG